MGFPENCVYNLWLWSQSKSSFQKDWDSMFLHKQNRRREQGNENGFSIQPSALNVMLELLLFTNVKISVKRIAIWLSQNCKTWPETRNKGQRNDDLFQRCHLFFCQILDLQAIIILRACKVVQKIANIICNRRTF